VLRRNSEGRRSENDQATTKVRPKSTVIGTGFERWVRAMGSSGGFERWVRAVGSSGGFERWVRAVGSSGGFERWVRAVGSSDAFERCVREMRSSGDGVTVIVETTMVERMEESTTIRGSNLLSYTTIRQFVGQLNRCTITQA
jgi:hypothetical protein